MSAQQKGMQALIAKPGMTDAKAKAILSQQSNKNAIAQKIQSRNDGTISTTGAKKQANKTIKKATKAQVKNPSPCKPFKIQFPKGSKSFQKVEALITQGMTAKDACEKIKKENQELDKQQLLTPKSNPKSKSKKNKKGGYKSKKQSPTKKKRSRRKPMLVIF